MEKEYIVTLLNDIDSERVLKFIIKYSEAVRQYRSCEVASHG